MVVATTRFGVDGDVCFQRGVFDGRPGFEAGEDYLSIENPEIAPNRSATQYGSRVSTATAALRSGAGADRNSCKKPGSAAADCLRVLLPAGRIQMGSLSDGTGAITIHAVASTIAMLFDC